MLNFSLKGKKTRKVFLLLFISFIFVQTVFLKVSQAGLIPEPLLKWDKGGSEHVILVDKSIQKIFLYRKDRLMYPLKVYLCSTGENYGPKTHLNDKKTPEGVYFFTNSYKDKDLAPIYGIMAFPLDYPNNLDKKKGRNGYGIWLHGTNKQLEPRNSNGCIVLKNKDIEGLAAFIKLHETPLIITSRINMIPIEKNTLKALKLKNYIEYWKSVWEEKNIEQYMSFYSPEFSEKNMGWKKWKKYKSRIAAKHKNIEISIYDLQLFQTNGSILAKFYQIYHEPYFKSYGNKTLYLIHDGEQYKIIGEVFEQDNDPQKYPAVFSDSFFDEIKGFLFKWKKAWEQKRLQTYFSFYDQDFHPQGMHLAGWYKHKNKVNKKYKYIKIEISKIKILKKLKNTIRVNFKQDFKSDSYHDIGLKELILIKSGNNWKIKQEIWQPITVKSR